MTTENIILIHGALGSSRQLDSLKEKLSASFDVFSFDLEGHGGRPSNNAFNMALFCRNLHSFMESHNLNSAHLFGYSMGGYIALTYANLYPEQTGKIITLGTKFHWTPESAAAEIRQLDPEKITEKVPQFAETLAAVHGVESWKGVVTKTADMMHRLGNGEALTITEMSQVKHEVLLLLGENDKMVTREETEDAFGSLPHANIQIIPDAKHPIESVDPTMLATVIRNFTV